MNYLFAGIIGLVSGITSGLFGVGGGVVMVPAMMLLLSPPIRDIKQAIGTSLVVIIPTALMGAFKHYNSDPRVSNIHWPTVLSLVPTAIIGGYLGAWMTSLIHADSLKRAFGAFIIVVGFRLLFVK
jgi:uncharacterized membrane protein YfcA